MSKPTFDVAITTYRRPDLVLAAVRSCLNQGEWLNRVIVVDDASDDDAGKKLLELKDDRIVFHQRKENGGIGAARRDSFELSDADWTIMLDSDHELLPNALSEFTALARQAGQEIGILGARFRWDNGSISPVNVPSKPINYAQRISWCSRPDGIGSDYLCCIARGVRDKVKWQTLRGGVVDTLFHLDIAKEAMALFSDKCLALQKSMAPASHTRGSAEDRLARRELDAWDTVKITDMILARHCNALKKYGLRFYGDILQTGAYYAFLSGQRGKSIKWLAVSIRARGVTFEALGLLLGIMGGMGLFRLLYWIRG